MIRRTSVWVCVVLVATAGCSGRLDQTVTATLDNGGDYLKTYDLKGQPTEQTLKVDVTSTESDVDVFIVLADKVEEFEKANGDARAKVAADSKLKTKSASLSAVIPPKTDSRVIVQLAGMKKTEVTVKMTNKK